jgi:hypothetical protein
MSRDMAELAVEEPKMKMSIKEEKPSVGPTRG